MPPTSLIRVKPLMRATRGGGEVPNVENVTMYSNIFWRLWILFYVHFSCILIFRTNMCSSTMQCWRCTWVETRPSPSQSSERSSVRWTGPTPRPRKQTYRLNMRWATKVTHIISNLGVFNESKMCNFALFGANCTSFNVFTQLVFSKLSLFLEHFRPLAARKLG